MNLLVDALPNSVLIDGRKYRINSDFRVCLRTIMAFEDNDLTAYEKTNIMLYNLYPIIPSNIPAAIQQANIFLNGGKENKEIDSPRLYSFAKDANFIFAAFRQTHGIDLQKTDLHWHEFLALFLDLGQDTTFCQLVGLRSRLKSGKATKEERIAAAELGDLVEVPEFEDLTIEEREAEEMFMRQVRGGV